MSNAYNPFADVQTQTVEVKGGGVENPATDRQVAFLNSLLAEKDLTKLDGAADLDPTTLSKKGASLWIDALIKLPRPTRKVETRYPDNDRPESYGRLVTGYYAVDGKRYHLSVVEKGKWTGWIFLATGSDYYDRTKMGAARPMETFKGRGDRGNEVFEAILADPKARAAEYGQITGSCGKCGRTLEDPESVARGIGPVCIQSF